MIIEKTVKIKEYTQIRDHTELLQFVIKTQDIKHIRCISQELNDIFLKLFEQYENESMSLKRILTLTRGTWGKSNRSVNYWIIRGYTAEEAKQKINFGQIEAARKGRMKLEVLKDTDFDKWAETRSTRKEYWMKKGYTEDEAHEIISENARTGTLEKFIERAGSIEVGLRRFNEAQDRKRDSWNKRSDVEKALINKSKAFNRGAYIEKYGLRAYYQLIESQAGICRASDQSLCLLLPIIGNITKAGVLDEFTHYIGVGEKKEWFIHDGISIFMYDFCIPKLNIIVEYHGECWHPNINKLTESEKKEWKHPFGKSYNACLEKDNTKRELAQRKGFTLFEVYSSEDIDSRVTEISNFIIERYTSWKNMKTSLLAIS